MQKLQNYEVCEYRPKSKFRTPESFMAVRFIGLLILLALLWLIPWTTVWRVVAVAALAYALWTITDTIAVNISVALISRNPVNPLRSAVLAFFAFLHLVMAFALVNVVFAKEFRGIESPLDAVYFSIVTAATVGFGDITPRTGFGKALICSEILLSLFFVAVLFAIFITWTSEPPRGRALMGLDKLPVPDAGERGWEAKG